MWVSFLVLSSAVPVAAGAESPSVLQDAPGEVPVEEVTVWGQHAIRQARAEVVRQMEGLGYRARDVDGDVLFRPPERWMGKVTFTRDGSLDFGRVLVALRSAQLHARTYDAGTSVDAADARATSASLDVAATADDWALDRGSEVVQVVPELATWVLPSKRVLGEVQLRVLEALEPSVTAYRRVLWETDVRETLFGLAESLDLLWSDGTPLVAGAPVAGTPEERRAAVLDYWATRADSDEGRLVCDAIALWLRQTVQDSAYPATPDELAAAEARRGDGATLLVSD